MPVAQYDIALNYDTKAADASLAGFRARIISQLTELQAKSSKIELFKDLQGDSKKADEALQLIKTRSEELRVVLGKLSKDDVGFKQLTTEIKAVDKEFKAAEKSANAVADRIKLLDLDLKKAGIDTSNLAAEQLALAAAFDKAKAAASVQTARGVLGVTGAEEAKAQIDKLREAYAQLAAAQLRGAISAEELAVAEAALNVKIRQVEQSLLGGSVAAKGFNGDLIAVGIGGALIGRELVKAAQAAITFEQGLARVSSITNYTESQLVKLGKQVLDLTQRIGIDAPTAFAALYDIVSSGVPEQNAFSVLEQSAVAAIAGFTDVNTAARVGVATLNAYGLQTTDLNKVYDKLFVTVRDGVITFPELAQQIGSILPTARRAGVSLDELSAAMVVLTRAGFPAAEAATAAEQAIKHLATPPAEAAAKMRELGIVYNGFLGTIEQFAAKNLSINLLHELIPDTRGLRAVATLTDNVRLLREQTVAAADSAGQVDKAFKKLADTPEQQIKKFTASVETLKVAIGEGLLKNTLGFINAATSMLKGINELDKGTVALTASLGAAGLAGGLVVASSAGVALLPLLGSLTAAIVGLGSASAGGFLIGDKLAEQLPRVKVFGDGLGAFLGYAVTGVSEGFNLLSANIKGNVAEQDRASAALARNSAQYREYEGVTQAARLQIAELEKAQKSLTQSLDAAKNAAIDQTAQYATALAPVITAVDDAFNKVTDRINQAEGVIKLYVERLGTAQEANKQLFDSSLTSITNAAAAATAAVTVQLQKSQLAQVASSAQTTSLIIDQLEKRGITQIEAERLITNEVLLQGGRREISEIEAQKKIVAIAIDSNQKQLAELAKYAASAIAVLDQQNEARLALAIKTNGALVVVAANASAAEIAAAEKKNSAVLAVDIKNKEAKLALLNTLRGDYQKYIDFLVSEEQRFLGIAKDLNEKRRAFNVSIEDKLRELARGGLDAYQARADKILEVEQKLARAREELAKGNTKLAEDYAQKAISLAEQTAAAVKSADGKEITQKQALHEAQQLILGGQNIVNEAINQEGSAATKAADAFAKQRTVATESLQAIKVQIDEVTASLAKDVSLRIKLDSKSLNDELETFRADIEKQEAIQKVKLQFAEVKADIAAVKKSIEEGLDGVEVHARLDKLQADIKAGIAALPDIEITVKDDDLKALNTEFDALVAKASNFITVKFTVESNVKAIAKEITDLSLLDTKSKHTVVVSYVTSDGQQALPPTSTTVPGLTTFNRGGLVSMPQLQAFAKGGLARVPDAFNMTALKRAAIAKFANGGFVGKVPGSGNSDTFRTNLESGSFVLNQAASRALAENRAIPPGSIFEKGFDSIEAFDGTFQAWQDKLKLDPIFGRQTDLSGMLTAALNQHLLNVRTYMLNAPGNVSPDAVNETDRRSRPRLLEILDEYSKAVSRKSPTAADAATAKALEFSKIWFDPLNFSGLATSFLKDPGASRAPTGKNANPYEPRPPDVTFPLERFSYAQGGSATGDVPAMLTPGELVFSPAQVARIGLDRLHALNDTKDSLRMRAIAYLNNGGFVAPNMPTFSEQWANTIGPRIDRFNAGGAVTNATTSNVTNQTYGPANVTINAASNVNERQLARMVSTELANIQRRSR